MQQRILVSSAKAKTARLIFWIKTGKE